VFDATYVISLDRSPERWASAQRETARAGLPNVMRYRGVDGTALDAEAIAALQAEGALGSDLSSFHEQARLGEIGCGLSHAGVLREIVARQWRSALILEDDVVLAGDAESWATRAREAFADLPHDWDVFYLYRCFDIEHRVTRLSARVVRPYVPQGGAAYAVSAAGAARMSAALTPLTRAVDATYMELVRTRQLNAFAASPLLIDPGQHPSLINRDVADRGWVVNGINRPPEYWPPQFLAHLGEEEPSRSLLEKWLRAGRRSAARVIERMRSDGADR
jgi:GR25 family glycosyltransferase involved in LPS biosynthesis